MFNLRGLRAMGVVLFIIFLGGISEANSPGRQLIVAHGDLFGWTVDRLVEELYRQAPRESKSIFIDARREIHLGLGTLAFLDQRHLSEYRLKDVLGVLFWEHLKTSIEDAKGTPFAVDLQKLQQQLVFVFDAMNLRPQLQPRMIAVLERATESDPIFDEIEALGAVDSVVANTISRLKHAGINYVLDYLLKSEVQLKKIPRFGNVRLNAVKTVLEDHLRKSTYTTLTDDESLKAETKEFSGALKAFGASKGLRTFLRSNSILTLSQFNRNLDQEFLKMKGVTPELAAEVFRLRQQIKELLTQNTCANVFAK